MLLTFGASPFGTPGGEASASPGGGGGVSLVGYATATTTAGPINAATAIRVVEPTP
jgi:hypothetical protein